jgi:hypothetical protein
MTIKTGSIALLLIACAGGCGGSDESARSPSSGTRARSEHENEPEYQGGLAETLERAPTRYAAEVMTRFYDLGYSGGLLEGTENRMRESGEAMEMGCMAVAPDLLAATGQRFRGVETCTAMKRADVADARFSGPRFAKGRLLTVRKGTETEDAQVARMLLLAYENGYAMGFARADKAGDPLGEMRTAVAAGCEKHIATYGTSAALSAKCPELGTRYVTTYLENLQRIRRERAMQ